MKTFAKFVCGVIAAAALLVGIATMVDLYKIDKGECTVSYTVATPTDGSIRVGVRKVETGPFGVVSIYTDTYLNGDWYRSPVLFDKLIADAYVDTLHIM